MEDLNLTDYVCVTGKIIQPKNIIYASRILINRICIYLSNKEFVHNIVDHHEYLEIWKHQKVIFSNVSPTIPNYAFEDILEKLNVKRGSAVIYLTVSVTNEDYKHFISFRRQFYVKQEDINKIPGSFLINNDDLEYIIYATTDVILM